ncbi:3'-5' exonuclease [Halomonas tibetensis]|uniref:Exonuclease domain-containing protein n=1 Tax=Halomonas tibetensis TaxID=2259590 RepID=A0ABV7B032_9GAMM
MDTSAFFAFGVWSLFFILLYFYWGEVFSSKKSSRGKSEVRQYMKDSDSSLTQDSGKPKSASKQAPAPKPAPASTPSPATKPAPASAPTPAAKPAPASVSSPATKSAPASAPSPAVKPAPASAPSPAAKAPPVSAPSSAPKSAPVSAAFPKLNLSSGKQKEKLSAGSILFFDVETTGLSAKSDRIVQIAWSLTDFDGKPLESQSHIIYPDGFRIPIHAAKIHGITTEIARSKGVDIVRVLSKFEEATKKSKLAVAHNFDFDDNFVREEFKRIGKGHPLLGVESFCTMRSSTSYCKLPFKGRGRGYKWPKLEELHMHLFSIPMMNAHDAMADVDACKKCYHELKRRGVFK